MEEIYGWLRNITCFILFMSVLDNLLPGRKYGKFLKLFAGMVLILLVVQPFTGELRLEDRIAHNYESFVFRNQAGELKQEMLGIEEQRLDQMIRQYEEAVKLDVEQMVLDTGLVTVTCDARIQRDMEDEQFGSVTLITMTVAEEEQEEEKKASAVEPIAPVEEIVIGERVTDSRIDQENQRTALAQLRKKIASYYNLEEIYVEIQIVEGKG